MHSVSQIGLPPLRFKGRVLSRHQGDDPHAALFVSLWSRKTSGDVVLGYSELDADLIRPHAIVAETPGAAAEALERLCQRMPDSLQIPLSDDLGLTRLHRALGYHQGFSRLVGAVLADWDARPDLAIGP